MGCLCVGKNHKNAQESSGSKAKVSAAVTILTTSAAAGSILLIIGSLGLGNASVFGNLGSIGSITCISTGGVVVMGSAGLTVVVIAVKCLSGEGIEVTKVPGTSKGDKFKTKKATTYDVTSLNAFFQTPLFEAVDDQKATYKIERLIACGADVNALDQTTGLSALHRAIQLGDEDIVRVLLASDADLSVLTTKEETILSFVVRYKQLEILKILVDYDEKGVLKGMINILNEGEQSPLHDAISLCDLQMIIYLVENLDPDLTLKNGMVDTPLGQAQALVNCKDSKDNYVFPEMDKVVKYLENKSKEV